MTREEAITILQEKYDYCKSFYDLAAHPEEDYPEMAKYLQALQIVLSALRPVTREQVEKMRGEWIIEDVGDGDRRKKCSLCNQSISGWWGRDRFCANCGSPMTDEAVQMVMERMEKLKNADTNY